MTTGLDAFNALPEPAAAEALAACCAAGRWVTRLVAGRPYPSAAALHDAAAAEFAELGWPDVLEALDAHPRIGQRVGGGSREAAWSRGEQAGTARAGETALGELAEANAAYEAKFGFVFLIRASGRGVEEMLAACQERLGHDEPRITARRGRGASRSIASARARSSSVAASPNSIGDCASPSASPNAWYCISFSRMFGCGAI